ECSGRLRLEPSLGGETSTMKALRFLAVLAIGVVGCTSSDRRERLGTVRSAEDGKDPMTSFLFGLKITDLELDESDGTAFFRSVDGLATDSEVTDYDEGGLTLPWTHGVLEAFAWPYDPSSSKPGTLRVTDPTFASAPALVAWKEDIANGHVQKRHL